MTDFLGGMMMMMMGGDPEPDTVGSETDPPSEPGGGSTCYTRMMYYVNDQYGSVRSGVNRTSTITGLIEYYPYGEVFAMSGGEMQRVAIARALANDPDIILADEPTGNLDSASGKAIVDLFKELWQAGKTIVIITHDMSIADQAERVIRLKDGLIDHNGNLH